MNKDSNSLVDDPTERTKRFVLEFEKPYKCDKCDYAGKQKGHLTLHKRVHGVTSDTKDRTGAKKKNGKSPKIVVVKKSRGKK